METAHISINVPDGYVVKFYSIRPGVGPSVANAGDRTDYNDRARAVGWVGYEWFDLDGNVVGSPLAWVRTGGGMDMISMLVAAHDAEARP